MSQHIALLFSLGVRKLFAGFFGGVGGGQLPPPPPLATALTSLNTSNNPTKVELEKTVQVIQVDSDELSNWLFFVWK